MLPELKKWLKNSLNAYFLFVALAFAIGAYVFLLDNSVKYVAQIDVLVSAKSEKAALNLDKIRENIIILAQKGEILDGKAVIEVNSKNSFIKFEVEEATQSRAAEKSDVLIRSFIDHTGRYYDAQSDLGLEVVSKEVIKKETGHFGILIKSLFIGLVLSLVVQVILDLIEKAFLVSMVRREKLKKEYSSGYNDLENVFKFNSEKIRKLSSDFEIGKDTSMTVRPDFSPKREAPEIKQAPEPIFKKAASPINLPVAPREDFQSQPEVLEGETFVSEDTMRDLEARAFGSIVHSDHQSEPVEQPIRESILKAQDASSDVDFQSPAETEKEFIEPTEEDFKRKLNQLLGNR